MEALGVMSADEVYQSVTRGAYKAAAIRHRERPAETFRFPHALLMLAIGSRKSNMLGDFELATTRALEWSTNPRLDATDAEAFVRKLVRQHKADIIALKAGE